MVGAHTQTQLVGQLMSIGEIRIIREFNHNGKRYCLFAFEEDSTNYLYIQEKHSTNQSLLVGRDLEKEIIKNLRNPKIECLECQLRSIQGGVAKDGGDIVESEMTSKKANKILGFLQQANAPVRFF